MSYSSQKLEITHSHRIMADLRTLQGSFDRHKQRAADHERLMVIHRAEVNRLRPLIRAAGGVPYDEVNLSSGDDDDDDDDTEEEMEENDADDVLVAVADDLVQVRCVHHESSH